MPTPPTINSLTTTQKQQVIALMPGTVAGTVGDLLGLGGGNSIVDTGLQAAYIVAPTGGSSNAQATGTLDSPTFGGYVSFTTSTAIVNGLQSGTNAGSFLGFYGNEALVFGVNCNNAGLPDPLDDTKEAWRCSLGTLGIGDGLYLQYAIVGGSFSTIWRISTNGAIFPATFQNGNSDLGAWANILAGSGSAQDVSTLAAFEGVSYTLASGDGIQSDASYVVGGYTMINGDGTQGSLVTNTQLCYNYIGNGVVTSGTSETTLNSADITSFVVTASAPSGGGNGGQVLTVLMGGANSGGTANTTYRIYIGASSPSALLSFSNVASVGDFVLQATIYFGGWGRNTTAIGTLFCGTSVAGVNVGSLSPVQVMPDGATDSVVVIFTGQTSSAHPHASLTNSSIIIDVEPNFYS